MSKYTLDEAMRKVAEMCDDNGPAWSAWLVLHAHLAAQAEWPSDEDVAKAYGLMVGMSGTWQEKVRAALQSVRPPVGVVSDGLKATAMECVKDIRKHAKQVHDLPLLQQDLRRLANRIERKLSRHAPTKD